MTSTLSWRELLAEASAALDRSGLEVSHDEARWLVEESSGFEGANHFAHLDDPVTERAVAQFDSMLARRLGGEPIQYVLGHWPFRSLDLAVDSRVLIPRPETEQVVELALAELDRWVAENPAIAPVAADLGTGSGAIALSLACERKLLEVRGCDRSPGALALARANLSGIGAFAASRVRLTEGDWFDALPGELAGKLALVVANPPYIASSESLPAAVVDWEPAAALVAGESGLEDLERIVAQASRWLAPGGALVIEIGSTQGAAVVKLAEDAGFERIAVRQDLAGLDRALICRLGPAGVLKRGGVVLLPTDTVYGIAALPSVPGATRKLFALKDRGHQQPLAVLVADERQALELCDEPSEAARRLMTAFWPGPLTLVLRRSADAEHLELGGDPLTIGVRCPDHDLVRELAQRVGPIATTSANRHGEPTPATAAGAAVSLQGEPDLTIDGGVLNHPASTVVDLTGADLRILRIGAISAAKVDAIATV